MTTEEKAKAYDEALKRAKEVCDMYRNGVVDKSNFSMVDIEYVFPQLAESEDERIIVLIRKLITNARDVQSNSSMWRQYDDALAWLERQKEQKPVEWSEDDLMCLGYLADFVDKNGDKFYGDNKPSVVKWIRSFINHSIPESTEWSEEDRKILDNLIWDVHMKSISPFDEMDDSCRYEEYEKFLMSLPERFNLQPKQEWSEEDERMLSRCIKSIECSKQFVDMSETFKKAKDKEIAWLKSLRPSHWKPSAEQMNAIDYVLRYDKTGGFRDALKSLYDQLYNMYNDV